MCDCIICSRQRNERLRADLNAMADRRSTAFYIETPKGPGAHDDMLMASALASLAQKDIPIKTEYRLSWTVTALVILACAFAAGIGYEAIRHVYAWIYSLFG